MTNDIPGFACLFISLLLNLMYEINMGGYLIIVDEMKWIRVSSVVYN